MGDTVRFHLNGVFQEIRNPDPTLTLLNFLRYEKKLTGTKEGCAEGDCGACTVVVSELADGQAVNRAVNACILFLPAVDGKCVTTVEGIRPQGGPLHPVQRAMIDANASQCGFCTPGFVMSLYAHYINARPTDRRALSDALAGNLCRCTGYGPIIAAGQAMHGYKEGSAAAPDAAALRASGPARDMLQLAYDCPVAGVKKYYYAPRSLAELDAVAEAHPDAVFLAGGTDVGLWVTKQHRVLEKIIDLGNVAALNRIAENDTAIEIGGTVRYGDAASRLGAHYPALGELIRRLGSVQIRNCGTIGGNIANGSPIGDSMPPLIALGAELVLRHRGRERRMPLEDFFLDYGKQDRKPGEYIAKVLVPKPKTGRHFRCYKISKRFDQDISAVCAAFAIDIADTHVRGARIAFGGMAAIPKRAQACEAALTGKPWTWETVKDATQALATDFRPISDARASANYRMTVSQNLLIKAFLEYGPSAPAIHVLAYG